MKAEGKREIQARQHGDARKDENYFLTARHGCSCFSTQQGDYGAGDKCFLPLPLDTATNGIPLCEMI